MLIHISAQTSLFLLPILLQVAEAIVCALEQLCSKDDSDSDEEDTDHIRDYAHSLTAPEINMTPNSSPITPAIVRKSVSKPRTDRYLDQSSLFGSSLLIRI